MGRQNGNASQPGAYLGEINCCSYKKIKSISPTVTIMLSHLNFYHCEADHLCL